MLIFNKNVSFGGGELSIGLFFSAKFLGQLSTLGKFGKFRPGLILIGQILTTKVVKYQDLSGNIPLKTSYGVLHLN